MNGLFSGWFAGFVCLALAVPGAASQVDNHWALQALVEAYPEFLAGYEGNVLIWRDGTRMPFDDGKGDKDFDTLLADPDIQDQFYLPYPLGRNGLAPPLNSDPGRVRYQPLFLKMYGDCRKGEVESKLVKIRWLPSQGEENLRVTKVNGLAERLQAVSDELDKLPAKFSNYLTPSAGSYNCRPIAGTGRLSAHSFAAAIDINIKYTDYWRWSKPDASGRYPYKNRIPWEIVEIFERHGFIWGGKWYHYDTMHFEYRPELLLYNRRYR